MKVVKLIRRHPEVDENESAEANETMEITMDKPTQHIEDTEDEYLLDETTTTAKRIEIDLVEHIDDDASDHNVEILSQSMESCSSATIENETVKTGKDSVHERQPERSGDVDDADDGDAGEDDSFESLYDEIYEVELPATMYGIHRDPERQHIVFTLFDVERMQTTKVLRIDRRHRRLRTFIDGMLFADSRPEELTVELVTSMLADLEAQQTGGDGVD